MTMTEWAYISFVQQSKSFNNTVSLKPHPIPHTSTPTPAPTLNPFAYFTVSLYSDGPFHGGPWPYWHAAERVATFKTLFHRHRCVVDFPGGEINPGYLPWPGLSRALSDVRGIDLILAMFAGGWDSICILIPQFGRPKKPRPSRRAQ